MLPTKYTVVGLCPVHILHVFEEIKKSFGIDYTPYVLKEKHYILKDYPHFAIKRTFFINTQSDEGAVVNLFKTHSFTPFTVTFEKVDIFKDTPYGPTLFLEISVDSKLYEIHSSLVNLFEPLVHTKNPEHEMDGWRPHVSFHYDIPLEVIDKVEEHLKDQLEKLTFNCNQLYLMKDFDAGKDEREILAQLG